MFDQLKNISYKHKHYAIVSIFAVLALFMITATYYGTQTISAVRIYITGESQWTKAQKNATHLLMEYSVSQESELYQQFQDELTVQRGFKRARQTLTSDNPNYEIAFNGLRTANVHPEDIDLLIWSMQIFKNIDFLESAIESWAQADKQIAELRDIAERLHNTVTNGTINDEIRNQFIQEISAVDTRLTELESSFSSTMADAGRWIRAIIFWGIVGISILIIVAGYLITSTFFSEINKLNQQLSESENKFRKVLQYSRDVIYQLDFESGEYEYMSPYVEQMLGYSPEQILESGKDFILDRVHPKDLKRMEQELQEMEGQGVEDHFASETEFRIKTRNKGYIWVNNQRSLVKDEEGNPVAIVGSVRDISERKKHEVETQKSLKEKQTLLEEIHHRVKNNLAVVSSLLELQKNESTGEVRATLEDTQSRIHSIAMIHEKLYQTDTLSEVDIKEYIQDFTTMIADTNNSAQKNISISGELQSFKLAITKAVPLGLIFNELLSNVFKHGFNNIKSGEISLMLQKNHDTATLAVADNGHPLPDDFSLDRSQSMGMTLIKTLVQQLEGEIDIQQNGWTTFRITFPIT